MLRTFNNYYLTTHIIRRVMWDVYLAHPISKPELNVVLKIFDDDCLKQGVTSEAVAYTANLLTNLKHPHISSPTEIGLEQQQLYVVNPYITNTSLQQYLDQLTVKALSLTDVLRIVIQIGEALVAAHKQNILHKNIRPENILFDSKEDTFLTDFSLDDLINKSLYEDQPDVRTIAYLAPEQLANEGISPKSDQYALGCLLYELVTGKLPFTNNELYLIWQRGVQSSPIAPSQFITNLPKPIEEIILQALALQPAQRHPDITTLIDMLKSQILSEPPDFPFGHMDENNSPEIAPTQRKNSAKKKKRKIAPRVETDTNEKQADQDILLEAQPAQSVQNSQETPLQRHNPRVEKEVLSENQPASSTQNSYKSPLHRHKRNAAKSMGTSVPTDPGTYSATSEQRKPLIKPVESTQWSMDGLPSEPDLFEWLGEDDNAISSSGEAAWIGGDDLTYSQDNDHFTQDEDQISSSKQFELSLQNSTDIPVIVQDDYSSNTAKSHPLNPYQMNTTNDSELWWERDIDEGDEKVVLAHVPSFPTPEEEEKLPYVLEDNVSDFEQDEEHDDDSPSMPEPTFPFSHLLRPGQRQKTEKKKKDNSAKTTRAQSQKTGTNTLLEDKVETPATAFIPAEADDFLQDASPFAMENTPAAYPNPISQDAFPSYSDANSQDAFPSYPDSISQDVFPSYPDHNSQDEFSSYPDVNSAGATSTQINATPENANSQLVVATRTQTTYQQQEIGIPAEFRKKSNRLLVAILIIAAVGLLFSHIFAPIYADMAHISGTKKTGGSTASLSPRKPEIQKTPLQPTATSAPTATPQPTHTAQVTPTPQPTPTTAPATPAATSPSTTAATSPSTTAATFTYFNATGGGSYDPASINLTNDGSLDWAHWGYPNAGDAITKNVQSHKIGSVTWNGTTKADTNQSINYSWSDATSKSVNNITSGTDITGNGGSATFPVTTDGTAHTLKVYAGAYLAMGTFTVSLNGKTAYTKSFDMTNDPANKGDNTEFTLSYNTNVASQMTITYTLTKSNDSSSYIILEAASIS